jgi:D-alanyl-lipoteichoic acid acyltransferase DltB (MBOAT superfamily)
VTVTSIEFFTFILVVLVFYYLSPKRSQNLLLLIVSYAFYAMFAWHFPLVLLLVTILTYYLGKAIRQGVRPKLVLWAGILVNLAILGYLKHWGFFLDKLQLLLGESPALSFFRGWEILFPVGLSYYSLQAISYLVDLARGQLREEAPFMHFALYLSYFPKMLSGPIERAGKFISQISSKRVVDNQAIARSFSLVIVGLARKILIANPLAVLIQGDYFDKPWQYSSFELVLSLLAFVFMLYNDFAGYTSIVRGVSGFFGIEISPNFRQPFFSKSLTEFWIRWHSTLSSWLRDYIYMPLTRIFMRRRSNPRWLPTLVIPPLVTLIASATWHGLSRTFLIWGFLMGSVIAAERVIQSRRPMGGVLPMWRQVLSWGVTLTLVLLTVVPFVVRLHTLKSFWWGFLSRWGSFDVDYRIAGLIAISLGIDVAMSRDQEMAFLRWPRWLQAGALAVTILALFLVSRADYRPPFVYQGF